MAGSSIIGALRVVLGADTAALDKGLKDSQSALAAFGAGVAGAMAAAAAAAAAAAVAIGYAAKNSIDEMDKLSKMSTQIGVPIEQLSALKYAADLSDVSIEELGKSVAKLSKSMVDAAAKPTSEAAAAFRALGVSVTDSTGHLRSSQEVLGDVADRFSGLKDGAGKTAASIAIFGRAGANIIPLLNDGRDGLKEMTDEAGKLGLVIDSQTGKAAEDFNDNLTRLKAAWTGIITQATAKVLPTLVSISDALVDTTKNSGILDAGLKVVTVTLQSLVSAGVIVSATFQAIGQYISAVSNAIQLVAQGDFAGAFKVAQTNIADIKTTASSTLETLDKLWNGAKSGADGAAAATDKASKSQKDFNFSALGGKNAIDQFIASQEKSLVGQQAQIQTFGMLPGQMEATRLQLQALAIAQQNHTTITATQQAQLDLLKQKTADYAMTLAGLQLTQANLTPAQLFEQEQLKIQALFDAGKISAETYGQAMANAAERANTTWAQAGESMAGSFAQIAGSFSKESSAMATAAKIFGAIQATISMFTGASKALELPFPANLAAVAAVLAKGASLVASIKSQSIPTGMQTGGAMTVRGGGGPDSVPVQIMASPGEQIDVWRPDQGGGPDPRRGAGTAQPVNLAMPIATTRDALRELIDGLNGMFRDGYRLNVVAA